MEAAAQTSVSHLGMTEIRPKVNQLLSDTGLDGIFPVPAERLALMLGYHCYYFAPSDNTRHISGAVDHDKKQILINENDPLPRQFFTLAHEIGHIILHKNKGNKVDFRTSLLQATDPVDKEADIFAAELLMPAEEFKKIWKKYKNTNLAAAYFGVSKQAANHRIDDLKLSRWFSK